MTGKIWLLLSHIKLNNNSRTDVNHHQDHLSHSGRLEVGHHPIVQSYRLHCVLCEASCSSAVWERSCVRVADQMSHHVIDVIQCRSV